MTAGNGIALYFMKRREAGMKMDWRERSLRVWGREKSSRESGGWGLE